jgi:hypothetical protein
MREGEDRKLPLRKMFIGGAMNAAQLKESIEKASKVKRPTLEKLFYYVTLGNEVRPEFKDFAAGANTYKEFFDALYACEDFKNTEVWAEWAKLEHKNWLQYFKPKININNMRLKSAGIPIEFSSGIVVAPVASKDTIINFYVYSSNSFNTDAAEFVTSIGGTFLCAGYEFVGIYGVYKYHNNVIFEEWEAEGEPQRASEQVCNEGLRASKNFHDECSLKIS